MKTNIRGKVLPAEIIDGRGYADLQAVVDALGLAELVIRLAGSHGGIHLVKGTSGAPMVALRSLAEQAQLPHSYDGTDDTFYIDAQPLPALPAEPVGATTRPWHPVTPVIASGPMDRSPGRLERVLRQFQVETNPRYRRNQQGHDETYCNIYLWDSTRALGCEIPHVVNDRGESVPLGQGRELDANAVVRWMRQHGPSNGWRRLPGPVAALEWANLGRPVVALWEAVARPFIGHVAMVRPGTMHPTKGVPIAQAGATNCDDGYLVDGFGARGPIEYWAHD